MYHFLALHEIDPTYLVAWSCLFLTDAPADIVVIEEADKVGYHFLEEDNVIRALPGINGEA